MIPKQLIKRATLVAIAVVCVAALAWGAQAVMGQGDRPEGVELAAEGQPAAVDAVVPGGPLFYTQAAYAFRPFSQASQWAFSSTALHNPGPAQASYEAALSLPHGTRVTQLVVYFRDNSAADLTIRLLQCPLASTFCNLMASINSAGVAPGFRSAVDTTISYSVVDNQSNQYIAEVQLPSSPGSEVSLNGIRVDYGYSINVPVVLKGQ